MKARKNKVSKPSYRPFEIAVIGGSGLYDMPELTATRELRIDTPFGPPSDAIIVGTLEGVPVAFLPRHGRGHRFLPSEIPSRANLYALKSLGVKRIIGIGACGSLKENLKPLHFVVPDQIVDYTRRRPNTFFGNGVIGHVSLDRPFCGSLSDHLFAAATKAGIVAHRGGTYVCMEGPAFSTKAESASYRAMGFDVIGMTAAPEHKLAREAEICYSTLSLITDYDVWKDGAEVSAGSVVENLRANVKAAQQVLKLVIPTLASLEGCACHTALRNAVFTPLDHLSKKQKKGFGWLLNKYWRKP